MSLHEVQYNFLHIHLSSSSLQNSWHVWFSVKKKVLAMKYRRGNTLLRVTASEVCLSAFDIPLRG